MAPRSQVTVPRTQWGEHGWRHNSKESREGRKASVCFLKSLQRGPLLKASSFIQFHAKLPKNSINLAFVIKYVWEHSGNRQTCVCYVTVTQGIEQLSAHSGLAACTFTYSIKVASRIHLAWQLRWVLDRCVSRMSSGRFRQGLDWWHSGTALRKIYWSYWPSEGVLAVTGNIYLFVLSFA